MMKLSLSYFGLAAVFLYSAILVGDTTVRVISGNLSSGPKQNYDEGHGQRIFKGARADVGLVQEFNFGDNSPQAIRRFVDQAFGPEFYYYREPYFGNGMIPNGVVSRFPILDAGSLEDRNQPNRGFAWAKLDVPGGKKLWGISVHLAASFTSKRKDSARSLIQQLQRMIPAGDYVVLGGDLNTSTHNEETFSILRDYFVDDHIPVDQAGKSGTSSNRNKDYDAVLPNRVLAPKHSCLKIIGDLGKPLSFPHGLVVDSRVFSPLRALAPIRQGDSASKNMQHMGVVKEYRLPD